MMANKKFIISGTGCALADFLYTNVSFHSTAFEKYRSLMPGDGGLSPGKLVFTEELERFAEVPYLKILNELTGAIRLPLLILAGLLWSRSSMPPKCLSMMIILK